MRSLAITLLLLSAGAPAQQKQKKAPDVQVMEIKARREEGKITVDGSVKITGEKPLRGLVMVFDFRSPEHAVITSQKITVDDGLLENSRESSYHAEMADAARAVTYTVRAFDVHEKELRVANTGPFSIE